jgi:hypothetical protein
VLPRSQVDSPRERQRADVVKLLAQFALVDQIGQRIDFVRLIRLKVTLRVGLVAKHRLAHQQLVEIGVDQRPDDRVDLPFVVVDPGGDIDHLDFTECGFKAVFRRQVC